ncbi:Bug family tripartite tricarboxylate transporter substrate binding protein [Cupriavidus sp. USMAA2-4]|uniref:Bug family tripartite tricarboxylate transporter substrate binding protein n=1 Tax=Cupriavidus sp. USMAA2-4 TaxID=876364 RepID=UPI000AD977DA|nr:tripartite tricarboxylate transporter substrate binding protein [Cupriavidus sp. USMAA2-4]
MERSAAWTLRGALARMRGSLGAAGMAGAVGVAGLAGLGGVGGVGSACVLLASSGPARAGGYPDKPIRLVVPFPPGGGTDVLGRLVAVRLGAELKQTVVVENVAGATGTIGSAQVARAAPDGYTLLLGISATHAIAPSVFPRLPYAPLRDFAPVARLAYGGNVLVANPGFAAHDLPGLVAMARRPGADIAFGSWGQGSGGHLAGEAVNTAAGIHLRHIPYKGVSPMLTDVIGGTLPLAMSDLTGTLPLIRAGKVRALAVSGSQRSPALPDVPTFTEAGVPFRLDSWFALFVPARTPAAIVDKLEQATRAAMQDDGVQAQIAAFGMRYTPVTRAAFAAQMRDDAQAWAALVKSSGAAFE